MSRSDTPRQYKTLEKSNDYDHERAEEYAEAVMELKSLNSRREYLQELLGDHEELKEYMWTTKEGVTLPLHKIENDHLKNIMGYIIEQNRKIPAQVKAEARSRNIEVPDDSNVGVYTLGPIAKAMANNRLGSIFDYEEDR